MIKKQSQWDELFRVCKIDFQDSVQLLTLNSLLELGIQNHQ